MNPGPLLAELLPEFATELMNLLVDRPDLAGSVDTLRIAAICGCQGEFCASFYTKPEPIGTYGEGHSSIMLSPQRGMIVLDVFDSVIQFVEIQDRPDIREPLLARAHDAGVPFSKSTIVESDQLQLLASMLGSSTKQIFDSFHNDPERLSRITRIQCLAHKIFNTDEAVTDWLSAPAPALGGVRPIDIIETEEGAREVESVLHGIAHGNIM